MAASLENASGSLNHRWMKLTYGIEDSVCQTWWTNISMKYSESNRKYHNLSHLCNMFHHLDYHIRDIESPEAMTYAIFFHDLEYDPKSQTNEEDSVKHFHLFAKEAGLDQDAKLVTTVEELIMASKTHCTEEHKMEDVYGENDVHYFLDFDVSILGSSPSEYQDYSSCIREEYSHLPESTYNFLRTKVLKSFLQIPNIFSTKPFREKYEEQARNNIQDEITRLESSGV